MLWNIQLFDAVLALNSTVSPKVTPQAKKELKQTRDETWAWLVKYPLTNNNWCSFCEDIVIAAEQWETYGTGANKITTCNYDSIQTLLFAQYLLHHRDDPNFPSQQVDWKVHVPAPERSNTYAAPALLQPLSAS